MKLMKTQDAVGQVLCHDAPDYKRSYKRRCFSEKGM